MIHCHMCQSLVRMGILSQQEADHMRELRGVVINPRSGSVCLFHDDQTNKFENGLRAEGIMRQGMRDHLREDGFYLDEKWDEKSLDDEVSTQ